MTILSSLPSVENDIRTAFNSDHTSFHTDSVSCVAFHPSEPFFVTGSKDNTIKMWRMTPKPLENGQGLWEQSMYATCVATFRPNVQIQVTCVAFHPTAPLLVGGYDNGIAILWSYIGLSRNKVLTIDPMMYEEYGLGVFPPQVSQAGLTSKVLSVNFQVDSSKVTFLEIGRSNTNIVELQNVSHFVSSAENTARERNEQFKTRGKLVQALSGKFRPPGMLPPSPREGSGRFTGKEFEDAMRRLPVRPRGGVTVDHDNDWLDTQESRSQQGPPLQGELDSETREAIEAGKERDRWRERVQEAKRLQEIKLQRERELLSQPLEPPQPSSPRSPRSPRSSLQPKGGNRHQTRRKYRQNK
jgi:hypothetical protein